MKSESVRTCARMNYQLQLIDKPCSLVLLLCCSFVRLHNALLRHPWHVEVANLLMGTWTCNERTTLETTVRSPPVLLPLLRGCCTCTTCSESHPRVAAAHFPSANLAIEAPSPLAPRLDTVYNTTLVVLAPTRPSNYLAAYPGDFRRYAHLHMAAAPFCRKILPLKRCQTFKRSNEKTPNSVP